MASPPLKHDFSNVSSPGANELSASEYNLNAVRTDAAYDITLGVTASAAELNTLDGITSTTTELNYTDGVTSAIQTQLSNKQTANANLTTIAGLTPTTNNFMVAASSAWASRTPAQAKTALAINKTDVGLSTVTDNPQYYAGGTDVAVADGGTGSSTAAAARTALVTERAFQLNVMDYGATGDNSTNDRTAIQAALDASDGRTVYFPPGRYRIGSSLTMNPGQKIIGSIGSGYGDGSMPPTTEVSTIVALASMNAPLIVGAEAAGHVRIRDLHLDGNKNNNTTTSGIVLSDVATTALEAQWTIENVFVEACAVDGVRVGLGRRAVKVHNVWSMYNGVNGFNVKGSDCGFDSCISGANNTGFRLDAPVSRVTNCDIFGNTDSGIVVTDTLNMIHISGNGIDRNGSHGIYVGAGTWNVQIIGNLFHSNSQTTDWASHHIFVNSDEPQAVTIIGNSFGSDAGVTNLPGWCVHLAGDATIFSYGNTVETGTVHDGLISVPGQVIDESWVAAPAATGSAGVAGQKAYASGFFYVCVAANTWKRVALATW